MSPMITSEAFHVLRATAFSEAPVAVSRAHLRTLDQVRRSGCLRRLVALINADEVFTVSPFDRLAVLERLGSSARVLAVDGGARGRSGWVPAAWLQPDGRPPEAAAVLAALAAAAPAAAAQAA